MEENTTSLWGRVVASPDRSSTECRQVLGQLLERVREPTSRYLASLGHSNESARDLTQEFILYVLEKGIIDRFEPGRARFRTFLHAVLEHFLSDQRKAAGALKRGGGRVAASLDPSGDAGPVDDDQARDPSRLYAVEWARALLKRAWERMEAETGKNAKEIQMLKAYLAEPGKKGAPAYQRLADRFSCSYQDVANVLHRARGRLRDSIIAEIKDYVDPHSIEEELNDLMEAFQNP